MGAVTASALTDMARGPLMPMPTMAMEVMVAMEATEVMVDMDTARGPLMPMPTMAMEVMEVMAATAAMVDTDTERGPLMLMHTTAMEDMAVAAMVDTDMANGLQMLTTEDMDTADTEVTAMADMAMASNSTKSPIIRELSLSF